MNINNVDKNFEVKNVKIEGEMERYTLPSSPFIIYGLLKDEDGFCRMPQSVADNVSDGVKMLNRHTAGGRIRFATDSDTIEVTVSYGYFSRYHHMPVTGSLGFTLYENDPPYRFLGTYNPTADVESSEKYTNGFTVSLETPKEFNGKLRNYTLYMSSYNDVKEIVIGVKKGSRITGGKKYKDIKPILYYGSSITQGACAGRTDLSYQNQIEKKNNIDYVNLGFSGSAKAEKEMVDYLSTIDCSLFICDYDHNAPDSEHLRKTYYPLYKKFRETHKETPIIILSSPDYYDCPKWWGEREEAIEETFNRIKEEGDKNVYFIKGRTLFGKKDANLCTVDKVHPNDIGFYFMAKRIYKEMCKIDRRFK